MAAEARKPKESGEEKAAQIRVLIAEDNMINMKVAMGILRRMGYEQVQRCSCLLPEAPLAGCIMTRSLEIARVVPRGEGSIDACINASGLISYKQV